MFYYVNRTGFLFFFLFFFHFVFFFIFIAFISIQDIFYSKKLFVMTQHIPKGFNPDQQQMMKDTIEQMNNSAKKLPKKKYGGLTTRQKRTILISMFLCGACKVYTRVKELDFAGSLCGMRIVKHFSFHGVKLSTGKISFFLFLNFFKSRRGWHHFFFLNFRCIYWNIWKVYKFWSNNWDFR